jgi:hypothetical protein
VAEGPAVLRNRPGRALSRARIASVNKPNLEDPRRIPRGGAAEDKVPDRCGGQAVDSDASRITRVSLR